MGKKQPNILLFIPDGFQADMVNPDHECQTPNFDRLAQRGIRFTRAHTVTPTCSPARASLMTGLFPHNHGVLQVEHCVDDDQSMLRVDHVHWAQQLSAAGYRTGYFGKWHVERSNRLETFGWQVNGCDADVAFRGLGQGPANEQELLNPDGLAVYKTGPEGYNPILHYGVTELPADQRDFGATTRRAQDFLADVLEKDQPWACVVSFSEPNTPLIAGRDAYDLYDVDAIRLPENIDDDLSDRPALYRRQREILANVTDHQWREARACYYALITELDQQLAKLVSQLEKAGQLDRTVVIVLGDHGRYMGAHGFDAHNFGAFEEIYNIPLIVAGPGIAGGMTTDALVGIHDLCPTILELAHAPPIEVSDSRSFASLLADPEREAHRFNIGYAEVLREWDLLPTPGTLLPRF